MRRRTFTAEDETGETLVTLYDEGLTGATIAYREWGARTWGPPIILRETTDD